MTVRVHNAIVEEWVEHGLLTTAQGHGIEAYEDALDHEHRRRLPLAAEALGYLGATLSLIALSLIVRRFWPQMHTWARTTLTALATTLFLAAGIVARRSREPAVLRLSSYLWFTSTAAFALLAGIVAADVWDLRAPRVAMTTAAAGAAYAALLWARNRQALQLVAMAAGACAVAITLFLQPAVPPVDFIGLGVWSVGAIVLLLAWADMLEPAPVAYGIGGLLTVAGGQVFGGQSLRGWGLALALITALGLLGASAATRVPLLLGFGAAGLFIFVPQAVFYWFGDQLGAPVALLLTGLIMLSVALGLTRLRTRVRPEEAVPTPSRRRRSLAGAGSLVITAIVLSVVLTIGVIPLPAFPPMNDPSVTGTVAFLYSVGPQRCLTTMPAGGGPVRRVTCLVDGNEPAFDSPPAWTADGRLLVRAYDHQGPIVYVLRASSGAVLERIRQTSAGDRMMPIADVRFADLEQRRTVAASGRTLSAGSPKRGSATLRIDNRVALRTSGPRDYRFNRVQWSPDGTHILIEDAARRLLIADANGRNARLLVTDASEPAWFMPGVDRYTLSTSELGSGLRE